MAIKYRIQYKDIVGTTHLINIADQNYTGDITLVRGRAYLEYNDTDDVLECIRGMGLSVELEANQDLDFSDLYSEQEQTFIVTYYRDSEVLFNGFLNSEGYYESLVDENWIVNFTALDGTGFLENLSFVDGSGLPFIGQMKQIDVLWNALKRCGISKGITANIRVLYEGLANTENPLNNVYVNTQRYYKEDSNGDSDGATIMSCAEVIKDILEPYNAILISRGTEWLITRPNDMSRTDGWTYYKWNAFNVYEGTETRNYWQTIGSKSQGAYPHWVNGNLQSEFKPSLGAYRIKYSYGFKQSLLENSTFYTSDGINVAGWDIAVSDLITIAPANGEGITLEAESDVTYDQVALTSGDLNAGDGIGVEQGVFISFGGNYEIEKERYQFISLQCQIFIKDENSADTYYVNKNGEWVDTSTKIDFFLNDNSGVFGIQNVSSCPVSGELFVSVFIPRAYPDASDPADYYSLFLKLNALSITADENQTNAITGETHTFERTTNPNPRIEDVKEVYTGDSDKDLYIGTTYKNDKVTTTTLWTRTGFGESKPLLQIMGEERMRIEQLPSKMLSSDVYGYFDYSNYYSVLGFPLQNIGGVNLPQIFEVTSYNYNTKDNIISVQLSQVFHSAIDDIEYTYTEIRKNAVKPTIKS